MHVSGVLSIGRVCAFDKEGLFPCLFECMMLKNRGWLINGQLGLYFDRCLHHLGSAKFCNFFCALFG